MIFGIFGKKSLPLVVLFLVGLIFMPYVAPRFYIYLVSAMLVTGLLATSLNLVLGYGGMYQFHHAVFYGVGAYTTALMLTKTSLPTWVAFVSAPLAAAFFGLVIGLICARLSSLHFGMLQISLGSLLWVIVYRWYDFTGGDDGIHGISMPAVISGTTPAYYFILTITALCLLLMFIVIKSPFGRILQALRDNPERCAAIGVNVIRHRILAMIVAALFAGVAGSLFVTLEGSVFPDLLFWTLSLEILIMCLLGGWFTFFGPMLGACLIISLRTFAGNYTEYWTLILGLMMMLTIFFLPKGVLGFVNDLFRTRVPGQSLEESSHAPDKISTKII